MIKTRTQRRILLAALLVALLAIPLGDAANAVDGKADFRKIFLSMPEYKAAQQQYSKIAEQKAAEYNRLMANAKDEQTKQQLKQQHETWRTQTHIEIMTPVVNKAKQVINQTAEDRKLHHIYDSQSSEAAQNNADITEEVITRLARNRTQHLANGAKQLAKTDLKPQPQAQPKPAAQPVQRVEAQPQAQPKPAAQPVQRVEAQPQAQPKPAAQPVQKVEAQPKAQPKPAAQPVQKVEAQPQAQPEKQDKAKTTVRTEITKREDQTNQTKQTQQMNQTKLPKQKVQPVQTASSVGGKTIIQFGADTTPDEMRQWVAKAKKNGISGAYLDEIVNSKGRKWWRARVTANGKAEAEAICAKLKAIGLKYYIVR